MKKLIALILALCIISCCFVGCTTTFTTTNTETSTTEPVEETTNTEPTIIYEAKATIVKLDIIGYGNYGGCYKFFASVIADDGSTHIVGLTPNQYVLLNIGDSVTVRKNSSFSWQIVEFNDENKFFNKVQ